MKHYFSSLKGDTIKAIFLVCLAVGVVGMSYGSLAMAYGFPLWVPFVLSITVLAGASEFMFIGIVASGGNPLAAAAAGLTFPTGEEVLEKGSEMTAEADGMAHVASAGTPASSPVGPGSCPTWDGSCPANRW